jgi:copper transporter 1
MLWNWYTIDSCFLAETWHNKTKGAFAGSVIGVFLLVIAIEAFRRGIREYDRRLTRQASMDLALTTAGSSSPNPDGQAKTVGGNGVATLVGPSACGPVM